MIPAAIGVKMHSGWGALVAVSHESGKIEILDRRRIHVTVRGTPGAIQPYHFVENFKLEAAEEFLANCFADSTGLAAAAIREVIEILRASKFRLIGSAIVEASGRPLPTLEKILAAHPLIHTAEGEFFREAFAQASQSLKTPVTRIRERELPVLLESTFPKSATRLRQQISNMGRTLGPPWTQDQKSATLAALLFLAKN
ncbi:MAG: hypothetical protein ACRD4K_07125 [Candidatus Acidiferrales bacterium]